MTEHRPPACHCWVCTRYYMLLALILALLAFAVVGLAIGAGR